MKLDAYLEFVGETESDFAERAGISRATVFRVKKAGARSAEVIAKIIAACGGKVTANELLGIKRGRAV